MDPAQVIRIVRLVTRQNSPQVLPPRKPSLACPAPLVAPPLPPVLRPGFLSVALVRRDHFSVERCQLRRQRVRVRRLVAAPSFGSVIHEAFTERLSDTGDLRRRSRLRVAGDSQTLTICRGAELHPFAPLGFPGFAAPVLAAPNAPSMKHCDKSNSPRVRRSSAKVSKIRWRRPTLTHCWNRRWQVWEGGNRSGRSRQRAPERRIPSAPFKTSRSGRRGRPRVCPGGGLSKSGSIKDHCWAVHSSRRARMQIKHDYF